MDLTKYSVIFICKKDLFLPQKVLGNIDNWCPPKVHLWTNVIAYFLHWLEMDFWWTPTVCSLGSFAAKIGLFAKSLKIMEYFWFYWQYIFQGKGIWYSGAPKWPKPYRFPHYICTLISKCDPILFSLFGSTWIFFSNCFRSHDWCKPDEKTTSVGIFIQDTYLFWPFIVTLY